MAHKYAEYLENYRRIVQQEKEQLAKLPEVQHPEIILDSDATEQEVEQFLHGPNQD